MCVKDAILSSAVGAIGLLAAAAVLDEKANAVPWVIHVLRNSNIKECYACIRNLAMDENNVETFIAQGGIEVILSKLKENMHEADTVANCLDALASLSENDEAAKRITDSGGIDTCKDWLKNHLEDSTSRHASAALALLGNLGILEENLAHMADR